jgi:hypothetical protein
LTISEIASSHTAEPVGRATTSIRRSATVLRVVLPLRWSVGASDSTDSAHTTGTPSATDSAYSANATDSSNSTDSTDSTDTSYPTDSAAGSADVTIADEVVVVINVDVIVAAPSASITPPSTPERTHSYADSK